METKAYFASSVPAALEVARQELGDNALLVNSRPAPPEMRGFGRLEVTFAYTPQSLETPRLASAHRTIDWTESVAQARGHRETASREIDDIRRQLADLRSALGRNRESQSTPICQQTLLSERLVNAGLASDIAEKVASCALSTDGDADAAVLAELASRMQTAPFTPLSEGESRTLALIGPPGRGKTTSLIKIAFSYGLAKRIPVRIYCAGAHVIGGKEQLGRYASILGVPFQAFDSLASLNLAMTGDAWKGLSLIDTPGLAPADRSELADFQSFFAGRSNIDKHLVLRADANSADLMNMVSRFAALNPSRILLTGLDEVSNIANVVNTLISAAIPATFFGTGQHIPDDLEEINADKLAWELWSDAASLAGRFAQVAA